jgi:hyperosmotically inducible protein
MKSTTIRGPRPIALGLALAGLLAVPGLADDADTLRRIEERFSKAGLGQDSGITVEVDEGVVRLRGITLTLKDARQAERAARSVAEVVINEIRVFPEHPRSDPAILKEAREAVFSYARYGVFDAVGLSVEEGIVRIEGFVLDGVRRREIEERMASLEGVRDVHNDLRLQGMSPHDERLRRQLYARIYGNPLFARYAGWAEPPVRIFVDRGRATLAGRVASKVELTVLGQIANQSLAFSVNNVVKIDGEAPEEDRPRDEG